MQKRLIILTLLSLIMTGCREETDLYFYTDQSWKVETALTVDEAIMDLAMGVGGAAVGSEFGVPIPGSLLESENWIGLSLDYIVAEYKNQGLEAKWRKSTNTYTLTVEGERYSNMPGASLGAIILEPLSGTEDQYHFRMETPDMGDLNDLALPGLRYDRVITLHAGRIIQSNAYEVNGGTAIWRNPSGEVDAVFVPASPFPAGLVFTILCLGSMIGAISLGFNKFSGSVKCPNCGKRVRNGLEFCSHCGGYVSKLSL
ncbi:MAG: zinc ribbon domain-containing protein [Anaerolineales bacterium]|nr:zinc ribbon domain-containing protein [Anaerolineales bacterium]